MDNLVIPQIKPEENPAHPVYMDVPRENPPTVIPQANTNQLSTSLPVKPRSQKRFNRTVFLVILGIVGINLLLILNVYLQAMKFKASTAKLKAVYSTRNFTDFKKGVADLELRFRKFKSAYTLVSWMRVVPVLGGYVADGSHALAAAQSGFEVSKVVLNVAEPYADLIGFSSTGEATDGAKTASERIDFMVKALPDVLPKLDEVVSKLDEIDNELSKIKVSRYPAKLSGKPLRSKLESGVELARTTIKMIRDGKPLIAKAPYLLGMDSPRTYLVLFQNDKELRPTGGFITAYSIMKVDKAKFEPVESDDIYNLDAKYKPEVPAPDPIVTYLKGPYLLSKKLRLRDMNWSPDFAESMKLFLGEVDKVGIRGIDGVIAVDTQLLVYLLDVIGPIGVPGFGNFSNEVIPKCNCPQVIYELEDFADVEGPVVWDPAGTGKIIYAPPNMDNRKKIIGPLMNSILANAFAQPKSKLPLLFTAGYKSLMEKHVLFYLFDEDAQKTVEGFGIGGRVSSSESDYLMVVDANLGGRKSNLYVTSEVSQEITSAKDGRVEKTLTLTYNNPEKQDGWLNSVLPDWVRVYVPQGSELLSFEGVQSRVDPYEELGKTVFAGYYELRPQGVAKISLKYRLPAKLKAKSGLSVLIQKQPGLASPLYTLTMGKKKEEFFLTTDREVNIKL